MAASTSWSPAEGGVEVLQVKRFTGRIGSSEQRQITDSWHTFGENPRLLSVPDPCTPLIQEVAG